MIRAAIILLAAAAPAAAQQPVLTFSSGKSLPLAPGQWSYSQAPTGSVATFGNQLTIRCDRASRTVTIAKPAAAVAALTIITDTQTRTLPPNGRLSAQDPLLDAITFSRGRFLVSGGIGGVLALPSWPEAGRAVEDCRN